MGKRQVQGINVSTPLVLPSFDFKVTSFQKAEVTGKIHRKSSSSLPIWLRKKHFKSHEVKMILLNDERLWLKKWLNKNLMTKKRPKSHNITCMGLNSLQRMALLPFRTSLLLVVAYFRKILSDCSGIKQRPQFNARNCA